MSGSSPKKKQREEPLVLVATAPNEPLAMLWVGILENEGIRSVIKSHDLKAAMYVPSLLSMSGIYVLASQADHAKEVLEPFLNETEETSPSTDESSPD
jgi:hypothetical protein